MGSFKRRTVADADRRKRAATLADIAEQGLDVFCWCNRCGHNAVIAATRLLRQLGPGTPVPEVGTHLRCTGCGSRDIATRPAWPDPSQATPPAAAGS